MFLDIYFVVIKYGYVQCSW